MKKKTPKSFSVVLLEGDSLVYNIKAGGITPRSYTPHGNPYSVTFTETKLDTALVRNWFVQNIVPLVGERAADELGKLIADEKNALVSNFLIAALEYRKTLK